MPHDRLREPIFTVTGEEGTSTTIDLSTSVGHQDLGFTLTIQRGMQRTHAVVGVYHTGEITLFCQLLAAALMHGASGVTDRIRSQVAALTNDLEPTLAAEHRLDHVDARRLLDQPWVAPVHYQGSVDDQALVVDTTSPVVRIELLTDGVAALTANWPASDGETLVSGMIWRSYHGPDESYSWLSRTPTAVFDALLDAVDQTPRPTDM